MTAFIIFLILCVIVYFIAFANRDKAQDYKIDPKFGYRGLVGEDKMRMDMTVGLNKIINKALIDAPSFGIRDREGIKLHLEAVIETYRYNCLDNVISTASNYKIPVHLANAIIDEMCAGAYAEHVLER